MTSWRPSGCASEARGAWGFTVGDIVTWDALGQIKGTTGKGKVTGFTRDLSVIVVDSGPKKVRVVFANPPSAHAVATADHAGGDRPAPGRWSMSRSVRDQRTLTERGRARAPIGWPGWDNDMELGYRGRPQLLSFEQIWYDGMREVTTLYDFELDLDLHPDECEPGEQPWALRRPALTVLAASALQGGDDQYGIDLRAALDDL